MNHYQYLILMRLTGGHPAARAARGLHLLVLAKSLGVTTFFWMMEK
jgi:hypothetical protein